MKLKENENIYNVYSYNGKDITDIIIYDKEGIIIEHNGLLSNNNLVDMKELEINIENNVQELYEVDYSIKTGFILRNYKSSSMQLYLHKDTVCLTDLGYIKNNIGIAKLYGLLSGKAIIYDYKKYIDKEEHDKKDLLIKATKKIEDMGRITYKELEEIIDDIRKCGLEYIKQCAVTDTYTLNDYMREIGVE